MSDRALPASVSAIALETAAQPTPARLSADAIGRAGEASALAQLTAAMAELKAMAVRPLLQRAVDALQAEQIPQAFDWVRQALERDEHSGFGWYLMGIVQERRGDFASSILAYEAALKLLPEQAEVANDLGRLAYRMGLKPQAEKLFRHFLRQHPGHGEALNNLACALRDQRRFEEAIDALRPAIEAEPGSALLWNTMGTIVAEQGDYPNSEVFLAEALNLDPAFVKARYNLGNVRLALGDAAAALECCDRALASVVAEDERQMMRLSRSTILMALGRLGEGWDEYEARLDSQFADATHFMFDRPRWTPGADLTGKSMLVCAEQGLGDEVLFANVLPDVIQRLGPDGRLTLAVEPRLVGLFQRSFPTARVFPHATHNVGGHTLRHVPAMLEHLHTIDLWAPMGSLLREFRRNVGDFPDRIGYITPDPDRVAYWRRVLEEQAPPGLKVGLLWKSLVTNNARHRFFSPFDGWKPILSVEGACFVNLQYGDCTEELAAAERDLGVRIWTPPGIDLKQDLDDIAALSAALDLVIGFANATLNIAAAAGAPAWLIVSPGAWPVLGQDRYLWYPSVRLFPAKAFGDWAPVMAGVADCLADRIKAN
jgi:cytochrome c-type biogenesis protein CcmH/NrfG